ncbi:MAG: carboxypeptidase-like regulatory domain-containing protein [Promethearchaeota archaeon]
MDKDDFMIVRHKRALRLKKAACLSILLLMILFPVYLMNFSSTGTFYDTTVEDSIEDIDLELSSSGVHPWWDSNWPYRTLINITNQAGVKLDNYGVSVVISYGSGEYLNKVNDTLKDIRVIEYKNNEPFERDFFIFQDFDGFVSSPGKATIYFNTNLTSSSNPQIDTYIYFGNMNVESTAVEYGLGLVKNGAFEYVPSGDDPTGDPSSVPHYYNPVGWTWSDDVPDDIAPRLPLVGEDSQTEDQATEWWQNCLVDTPAGDVQVRGTYTYKWGSNQTSITDTVGNDDQFAGVLYTDPFVVPVVNDGSGKIFLKLWQNVRIWGFDGSESKAWNDGYFVRVINATPSIPVDPDLHQQNGEYLEYFKGITHNNKGGYSLQNYTLGGASTTGTFDTDIGELTGFVTFDLSNYMGQNISLEIGMYGDENSAAGNYDTGFAQIDDVEFTYNDEIIVVLNEVQSQKSDITIIVRDIDGRIVSNAKVSLVQDSNIIKQQTTDESGKTIFTNLNFGIYNFTVDYIFTPSYENVVFNSTRDNFGTSKWNLYNVSDLSHTFILDVDIWTIDFEIVDWDDDLLGDGYIKIFDDKEGTLLKKISLVNGTARFQWNNASFYYYEVYFYNTKYSINDFLLNSSFIYRTNYVQNEKYYDHALPLNTYDQDPGNYYRVYERIYTGGSMDEFSHKKLVNFNITLENMQDRIDNMTIYYIDKNNQTINNVIYQNLTMSSTDFFKSFDIGTIDNDELKAENYDVYGILVDIQGYRVGGHTGLIKVNTTELTNIYNKNALAKMNIRVIDDAYSFDPVPFVSVKIWNGTNLITTLTTNDDGWASHDDETYKPFIFLIGYSYNITLRRIGNSVDFKINETSPKQWEPFGTISIYNYTLTKESSIILDYEEAPPPPTIETQIELITDISQAIWGIGDLHMTINISYTTDGSIWNLVPDEGSFICYVEDWETGKVVLTADLTPNYQGMVLKNYSLTLNSSKLSAGNDFKKYWFIVDGSIPGYEPPENYYQQVQVNAAATFLNLYDYETRLVISEYKKEFTEIINITVRFYIAPNDPLDGATVSFDWLSQPSIYFSKDLVYPGFYSCAIDTSLAINVGKYPITITASRENFTSQTIITFLDIVERPTAINGTTDLAYNTVELWVEDTEIFTYSYTDTLGGNQLLRDLDVAIYTWQELYNNGTIKQGKDGFGLLYENPDGTYSLDFNTEVKNVGFYYLYVNLQKDNYEARAALVNLKIKLREFDVSITGLGSNNHISVNQGDDAEIEVNLLDLSRGSINLESAQVVLNIGGVDFPFTEISSGIYTATISTSHIDTFITSKTLVGKMTIEMVNFTTQEITITVVVKMEEIFPGMPTFYFILITAAIVGVVGSVVAYRVIQQARIPKHIKKIRKIKGYIKSKKKIPASLSIPTKEEMITKLFGDDWKELGLSLNETLGIADSKTQKSPIGKNIDKNGGEEF